MNSDEYESLKLEPPTNSTTSTATSTTTQGSTARITKPSVPESTMTEAAGPGATTKVGTQSTETSSSNNHRGTFLVIGTTLNLLPAFHLTMLKYLAQ